MNATNLSEIRGVGGQVSDEKMDQVREILFGEYQRRTDAHIELLEERIRELELSIHRRLDALQARIDAVNAETDASQRTSMEEIAKGMHELSERVRRLPQGRA